MRLHFFRQLKMVKRVLHLELNSLCVTYFRTSRVVREPYLCDIGHIMQMMSALSRASFSFIKL